MSKHIIILVGPPGSGKTTYSEILKTEGYERISQDDQGKDVHVSQSRSTHIRSNTQSSTISTIARANSTN